MLLALTNLFFDESLESTSGLSPDYAVTGDFNGDGNVDLAGTYSELRVAFGNGNGTFSPTLQIDTGSTDALHIADLNSDGIDDLIRIASSGPVKIYLGTAAGLFVTKQLDLGSGNHLLTFNDFNNDGFIDIALVEDWLVLRSKIYFGNGDGTFDTPIAIDNAPSTMDGIFSADMTEDGNVDLVFSYDAVVGTPSGIVVYRGNGDGSFTRGIESDNQSIINQLVDVNDDGHLDVVANDSSRIRVYLGDGNGLLTPPIVSNSSGSSRMAVANFDSDQYPDAIMPGFNGVYFLRGVGDGTFASPQSVATGNFIGAFAAADLDGDGLTDLAAAATSVSWLRLLFGNGTGGFRSQQSPFTQINSLDRVTSADFNGDGLEDLASTFGYPGGVQIAFQRGSGRYDVAVPAIANLNDTSASGDPILAGDFDGDQNVDLVHVDFDGGVYLGNGDGTFAPRVRLSSLYNSLGSNPIVGDWNSDGLDDLFIQSRVFLSNGFGTFIPGQTFPLNSVALSADMNGDTIPDLILLTSNPKAVSVFLGRGNGTFASVPALPVLAVSGGMAIGQFDTDGKLDLILTGSGTRFFRGKGDGTFEVPIASTLTAPTRLVADIDDDGLSELVGYSDHPIYYEVLPDGTIAPDRPILQYPTFSGSLIATDFNSDGKLDVVAYGTANPVVRLHANVGQALAPSLLSSRLNIDRAAVEFLVDAQIDAGSLNIADLTITGDDGTPGTFSAISTAISPDGRTVRYLLPALPDGDYQFTLSADAINSLAGLSNARSMTLRAFILAGDLDRNRMVNSDDLLILAQNYGQTGKTFSQGNIDYSADGLVGFDDLLILAQRYGTTLLSTAGTASSGGRKTGRTRLDLLD